MMGIIWQAAMMGNLTMDGTWNGGDRESAALGTGSSLAVLMHSDMRDWQVDTAVCEGPRAALNHRSLIQAWPYVTCIELIELIGRDPCPGARGNRELSVEWVEDWGTLWSHRRVGREGSWPPKCGRTWQDRVRMRPPKCGRNHGGRGGERACNTTEQPLLLRQVFNNNLYTTMQTGGGANLIHFKGNVANEKVADGEDVKYYCKGAKLKEWVEWRAAAIGAWLTQESAVHVAACTKMDGRDSYTGKATWEGEIMIRQTSIQEELFRAWLTTQGEGAPIFPSDTTIHSLRYAGVSPGLLIDTYKSSHPGIKSAKCVVAQASGGMRDKVKGKMDVLLEWDDSYTGMTMQEFLAQGRVSIHGKQVSIDEYTPRNPLRGMFYMEGFTGSVIEQDDLRQMLETGLEHAEWGDLSLRDVEVQAVAGAFGILQIKYSLRVDSKVMKLCRQGQLAWREGQLLRIWKYLPAVLVQLLPEYRREEHDARLTEMRRAGREFRIMGEGGELEGDAGELPEVDDRRLEILDSIVEWQGRTTTWGQVLTANTGLMEALTKKGEQLSRLRAVNKELQEQNALLQGEAAAGRLKVEALEAEVQVRGEKIEEQSGRMGRMEEQMTLMQQQMAALLAGQQAAANTAAEPAAPTAAAGGAGEASAGGKGRSGGRGAPGKGAPMASPTRTGGNDNMLRSPNQEQEDEQPSNSRARRGHMRDANKGQDTWHKHVQAHTQMWWRWWCEWWWRLLWMRCAWASLKHCRRRDTVWRWALMLALVQGVAATGGGEAPSTVIEGVCMVALNVNGLRMIWDAKEGKWLPHRKMNRLWNMAMEGGWAVIALTETHCTPAELVAMSVWVKARGWNMWGTPGKPGKKGRMGCGITLMWKKSVARITQRRVREAGRLLEVTMSWERDRTTTKLLIGYMPVRWLEDDIVNRSWDKLELGMGNADMVLGDMNAEVGESTTADNRLTDLLDRGEWERLGNNEHTWRDKTIDHVMVKSELRGQWRWGEVGPGMTVGDHRTMIFYREEVRKGWGKQRVTKVVDEWITEGEWEKYSQKLDKIVRRGVESLEAMEAWEKLEWLQQREIECVRAVKKGKPSRRGWQHHMHIWEQMLALREWMLRLGPGHRVFQARMSTECRAHRWSGLREIWLKEKGPGERWGRMESWIHRQEVYHASRSRVTGIGVQHRVLSDLKKARKEGRNMVEAAFKILKRVKSKNSGGGGKLERVWEGDQVGSRLIEDPEEVQKEVQKIVDKVNAPGKAHLEALDWWMHKMWGPAKEREGEATDELTEKRRWVKFRRIMKTGGWNAVGVDGWSKVLGGKASDYVLGLHYDWIRECMREATFSESYSEWIALLLMKPGEDPSKVGRRRDIWLMSHGLKVVTLMVKEEYDRVAEVEGDCSQSGFTKRRGAPESNLVLRLQEEQARQLDSMWFRLYIDQGTFFMSIVREVVQRVEKQLGVEEGAGKVMAALHAGLIGKYETRYGLTKGGGVWKGIGQGCVLGPSRSKNVLKLMQVAVHMLAEGTHMWGGEGAIPQVFFADDGAMTTDMLMGLQVAADVCWAVAAMCDQPIGIKEDGSKTAWAVGGTGGREIRYELRLPDGRIVPLLNKMAKPQYKHLGSWAMVEGGVSVQQKAVQSKMTGLTTAIGTLRMDKKHTCKVLAVVVEGVLGFYGRSTSLGWQGAEKIAVLQRRALWMAGHRHAKEGNRELYMKWAGGGSQITHPYQVSSAAIVSEMDKALNSVSKTPVRIAVRSALALNCWRLGCRVVPWEWDYSHLVEHLDEDWVLEAYLKIIHRAGKQMAWVGHGGTQ